MYFCPKTDVLRQSAWTFARWLVPISLGVFKCFWTIYVWLQIYRRQWHRSGWNSAWWYISVFSFEAVPPGEPQNPKVWLSKKPNINISKTLNRSVTCQLELKISSTTGQLSKMLAWDGSPQGESPIRKNMYFLPDYWYLALIGVKICMMVHIGPGQVFSPFGICTPTVSPKCKISAL